MSGKQRIVIGLVVFALGAALLVASVVGSNSAGERPRFLRVTIGLLASGALILLTGLFSYAEEASRRELREAIGLCVFLFVTTGVGLVVFVGGPIWSGETCSKKAKKAESALVALWERAEAENLEGTVEVSGPLAPYIVKFEVRKLGEGPGSSFITARARGREPPLNKHEIEVTDVGQLKYERGHCGPVGR